MVNMIRNKLFSILEETEHVQEFSRLHEAIREVSSNQNDSIRSVKSKPKLTCPRRDEAKS